MSAVRMLFRACATAAVVAVAGACAARPGARAHPAAIPAPTTTAPAPLPEPDRAVRVPAAATPAPPPAAPARAASSPMLTVGTVAKVAQLTGPGSLSATDRRWNLYGADLGHTFWHEGSLYMVFGDSYGPDRQDWRSNTMARIASPDPAGGLRFASMVTGPTGAAAELLGSLKVDGVEHTVIPTAGVSIGHRMVLHYMSVRRWVAPGRWELMRKASNPRHSPTTSAVPSTPSSTPE